jgi:hypothetical protein
MCSWTRWGPRSREGHVGGAGGHVGGEPLGRRGDLLADHAGPDLLARARAQGEAELERGLAPAGNGGRGEAGLDGGWVGGLGVFGAGDLEGEPVDHVGRLGRVVAMEAHLVLARAGGRREDHLGGGGGDHGPQALGLVGGVGHDHAHPELLLGLGDEGAREGDLDPLVHGEARGGEDQLDPLGRGGGQPAHGHRHPVQHVVGLLRVVGVEPNLVLARDLGRLELRAGRAHVDVAPHPVGRVGVALQDQADPVSLALGGEGRGEGELDRLASVHGGRVEGEGGLRLGGGRREGQGEGAEREGLLHAGLQGSADATQAAPRHKPTLAVRGRCVGGAQGVW